MKAVQLSAPRSPRVVDLPKPEPAEGDTVVRVAAASVCATDRKLAANGSGVPRVPGHEVAGRLEDGTFVGIHPDVGCGRCSACRAGFENRCADRVSIGLDRDGGLAEWVAVPAAHAVPLDGIPVELAPILEPLACCLHAVGLLDVRTGDLAVVVGAGAMGILCTWALQDAGATVAVCQRSQERRELAAALGADAVLSPSDSVRAALGEEPRIAIVTAPGGDALEWAAREVAVGGVVHVFAGTPGGAPLDANLVHYRHLTLVGSTGSTLADYRRAGEVVGTGAIDLARLPRARVSLEDVPEILVGERDPRELKVIVEVDGGMP